MNLISKLDEDDLNLEALQCSYNIIASNTKFMIEPEVRLRQLAKTTAFLDNVSKHVDPTYFKRQVSAERITERAFSGWEIKIKNLTLFLLTFEKCSENSSTVDTQISIGPFSEASLYGGFLSWFSSEKCSIIVRDLEGFCLRFKCSRSFDINIDYEMIITQIRVFMGDMTQYSSGALVDAFFDNLASAKVETVVYSKEGIHYLNHSSQVFEKDQQIAMLNAKLEEVVVKFNSWTQKFYELLDSKLIQSGEIVVRDTDSMFAAMERVLDDVQKTKYFVNLQSQTVATTADLKDSKVITGLLDVPGVGFIASMSHSKNVDIDVDEALKLLQSKKWRRQFRKIKRLSWSLSPNKILTLETENVEDICFLEEKGIIADVMKGFIVESQLWKPSVALNNLQSPVVHECVNTVAQFCAGLYFKPHDGEDKLIVLSVAHGCVMTTCFPFASSVPNAFRKYFRDDDVYDDLVFFEALLPYSNLNAVSNSISGTYEFYRGDMFIDLEGSISGLLTDANEIDKLQRFTRVFMRGSSGCVFGEIHSVRLDRCAHTILCSLKCRKGDSGSLVFMEKVKNEFIAIGLISCSDECDSEGWTTTCWVAAFANVDVDCLRLL